MSPPQFTTVAPTRRAALFALGETLLVFSIVIPLIFLANESGRAAGDQNTYHLPVIRAFARQWPHPDLRDYPSATTPGYHLALAAVDRLTGDSVRALRACGSLFTAGLVATLAFAAARRAGLARAFVLCLPLICSVYTISPAVWLLPDSAGWWGVLAILLLSQRQTCSVLFATSPIFVLLVLVRQSDAWVAAPLLASAWIGEGNSEGQSRGIARSQRIASMIFALLPGFAVLICFVWLWHGFVPPNQRSLVGGGNLAGPAMALTTVGTLGVFFLPLLLRRRDSASGAGQLTTGPAASPPYIPFLGVGALAGFLLGVVPVTTYDIAAGRFSGLWRLALHFPVVHGRSSIMVGLATAGGAVIGIWLAAMRRTPRMIWGTAVIAFGAVQLVAHSAFQRYDEPMVLLAAALSGAELVTRPPKWAWAGPIALAIVLALITVQSFR